MAVATSNMTKATCHLATDTVSLPRLFYRNWVGRVGRVGTLGRWVWGYPGVRRQVAGGQATLTNSMLGASGGDFLMFPDNGVQRRTMADNASCLNL